MLSVKAEVLWAVREEMVLNVEDFLSRRRRSLILNAKASLAMASTVAEIMKIELNKSDSWQNEQIENYKILTMIALNKYHHLKHIMMEVKYFHPLYLLCNYLNPEGILFLIVIFFY